MIEIEHISKTFKVSRRNAGFSEAFKALFHKKYERIKALDDISFVIGEGEMVGYIGPNGAGKSSTIKVLSGILTPEEGSCIINGRVPWKERIAHVKEIGVVFGQRSQLWWDVPVIDSYELLRDIYRIPTGLYKSNLEELVGLLNLEQIIRTPARQLSLGQRMRCEIAASLLHSPKILFLDEPTIGLDAISKIAVRDFILELNRKHRTTVILTTHDMQDIESLTKRIILIGKGKILMDGNLEDIKKQFSTSKKLTVEYNGGNINTCEGMLPISSGNRLASYEIEEGLEFMNVLTDGAREYGKYPLDIYGKGVLKFCTYLVPYTLFQYYPFLYLTGRSDNGWYGFLPILASLFALPCYLLWKAGLRHYKSTGS